ncbi:MULTISPECIES: lysozyme [Paenibacillus]|uniref:Lysozyme n=1 Tax=Paenibacillus pabuli TaxID=1472 RepID=A0A855Y5U2_9BACL|nr:MULTISPECIES: lysozyme [Paenibacillus]PWW37991.1 GH24 family phage-related lysozyme (muramidase) [Paenibacillus pabuli]PXW08218.1 GH24 family phage-related lysozyme (muramidase) [Paenibacillus taichungensis]
MANLSANGATFMKGHEGLNLKFYADPKGFPTVGYGHLITKSKTYTANTTLTQAQADALSKSLGLSYTSPITQSQANTFFTNDTASAVSSVNKVALPAGMSLSQNQFDALVSLTFNAGSGVLSTDDVVALLAYKLIYPSFQGPRSTQELDNCSKLVSKAFSYDRTLTRRRNEEASLFCKGSGYTHKYPVYTL